MERRVGGSGHDDGKIDLPLKDERPAANDRRPRGPLSRLLEGAKRCSDSRSPRQPGTARRGLAGASYGAGRGARYLASLKERSVAPTAEALANLARLDEALPEHPTEPAAVIALLDDIGSPATIASAGGRFFGFVVGGSLPATVAASNLAAAWDQNAGIVALSPIAARLEEVAMRWLLDLLGLPPTSGVGFVTCATQANFSGLAAARHALLARRGWNVEAQGLFGAPPITVVVGDEVHVSVLKALTLVGLGRERVIRVPVDAQGRRRAEALPPLDDHTLLCLQAGNVNTGAFDPADKVIPRAHAAGAWVHVDGAFGLWAAAAPSRAYLVNGFAGADSWAIDAHKWLNVPYDSGMVVVRDARHLHADGRECALPGDRRGARARALHARVLAAS